MLCSVVELSTSFELEADTSAFSLLHDRIDKSFRLLVKSSISLLCQSIGMLKVELD